MNRTQQLSALGQSLWLDNISRALLDDGTLARYIEDCSITGLTSNPTIFDRAIGQTSAYDRSIRDKTRAGHSGEALFIELALEDLRRETLEAFADHGELRGAMAIDGGDADAVVGRFAAAGIEAGALAAKLQRDGARAFVESWQELLGRIANKAIALAGSEAR